jgi:hypothetical protein
VYRKETHTKTSFDGRTERIEIEERNASGLLEFCGAIAAITLSIIAATLVLKVINYGDSSIRRLDRPINQSQKPM